jgi:hypothetical protein
MVVVHVGKEHRAELLRSYAKLGQPHCRAAPRVELQLHGRTAIGVIPITHQGSGTGETIERLWAALRARQGHDKAWRCVCGCGCCKPGGGKQCDKRHPHGRPLLGSKFAPCLGLQPVDICFDGKSAKVASWQILLQKSVASFFGR